MTEIAARLTTALADRYRIERELGAGGMATVYLANDLKEPIRGHPSFARILGTAKRRVEEFSARGRGVPG